MVSQGADDYWEDSRIMSGNEIDNAWIELDTPDTEDFDGEVVRQTVFSASSQHVPGPRIFKNHRRRFSPAPGWYDSPQIGNGGMAEKAFGIDGVHGGFLDLVSASAIRVLDTTTSPENWSSSGGYVEDEDDDGDANERETSWEPDLEMQRGGDEGNDVLLLPKVEPQDEKLDMETVQELSKDMTAIAKSSLPIKRPRGRPRKHPIPSPEALAKVTKGRSKTGCITCRKRKKKCDEAKPRCMNCEKNNAICEGYPDKTVWKSGKEKAEARLRRVALPNIKLQPVIHGVETSGDKVFFEHYIFRLSSIFTVEGSENNAFKDMILPMAIEHLGLMHSILALSSKHLDFDSPYGKKVLKDHPDVNVEALQQRSDYHHEEALKEFYSDAARQDRGDQGVIISARYGQMLCLILETLADPEPSGQHRLHLTAYQRLIQESPPEDGRFMTFIREFFEYHILLDDLIALPQGPSLGAMYSNWTLPAPGIQQGPVRLLGVSDGLFQYMSRITEIRNQIRVNMTAGIKPVVDYTIYFQAAEIDAGIREWTPMWPEGDARDLSGLLYKQMMWVYLYRTIYPPQSVNWKPDPRIKRAVEDGTTLLSQVPPHDPSQTIVLAPAFILGCAAFEPEQREPIRKAIGVVKEYMEYRNSDNALQVLEEVWRLMDQRDERSWDWQAVANGMGLDFLAT